MFFFLQCHYFSSALFVGSLAMALMHNVSPTAGAVAIGGAPCTVNTDCQLNGVCTSGLCVYAAWKGENCSELNFLPAKLQNGYGSLNSTTSSWGGGVIQDPSTGKFIMFVSEMNMHCGLSTWHTNSRCVIAESDTANGPYTRTQVLVNAWCHGASLGRDPVSNTWLYNHMGTGVATECTLCTAGVTSTSDKHGPCDGGGVVNSGTAVVSNSSGGPWREAPLVPNGANCEPVFHPNGSLFMACPSGGKTTAPNCNGENAFLRLLTADTMADALAGRSRSLPMRTALAGAGEPFSTIPTFCFNWEDQNLWIDKRGNFHALMHAYRGQPTDYPVCDRTNNKTFCTAVGGHAFSENGLDWYISPVIAFTPTTVWEDSTSITWRARERPHLLFDTNGDPTHLLNGVGNPGPGGNTGVSGKDHTFTLVQPLNTAA
eukprot:m.65577 g.65577  ORF g.65577 m.65577 type:complete len:429 (-) comp23576_c0_seq1:171-1457(-)